MELQIQEQENMLTELESFLDNNTTIKYNIICAIEEMAELTQQLTKQIRGRGNIENLVEEFADVEATLESIKRRCGFLQSDIDNIKLAKLKRFRERTLRGENK